MKNYGIEIEIIDKSGKNINGKEFICKINDQEVSENKDGMFLLKEKFEDAGDKKSYKIECADKKINVNIVIKDDNEIDIKMGNNYLHFLMISPAFSLSLSKLNSL